MWRVEEEEKGVFNACRGAISGALELVPGSATRLPLFWLNLTSDETAIYYSLRLGEAKKVIEGSCGRRNRKRTSYQLSYQRDGKRVWALRKAPGRLLDFEIRNIVL